MNQTSIKLGTRTDSHKKKKVRELIFYGIMLTGLRGEKSEV